MNKKDNSAFFDEKLTKRIFNQLHTCKTSKLSRHNNFFPENQLGFRKKKLLMIQ